jgi:hypothetical protein
MSGGEKRFAEMPGNNLLGLAHRSEVYAGVPAEQYIDVRRYILQLGFGERNRKEWLEEFGDAIGPHGIADFRLPIADWLAGRQHLMIGNWRIGTEQLALGI